MPPNFESMLDQIYRDNLSTYYPQHDGREELTIGGHLHTDLTIVGWKTPLTIMDVDREVIGAFPLPFGSNLLNELCKLLRSNECASNLL